MSSNPHGRNPNGETLHGIDVAYPQGLAFDWSLVAADGIRFAWCKATGVTSDGRSFVDNTFRRNWKEAQQNGVLVGPYHFLAPDHPWEKQANHLLSTIDLLGGWKDHNLHPMLDVEVMHGQPNDRVIEYTLAWAEYVKERTGRSVVLYTFPSFWKKLGEPKSEKFSDLLLWMAHWCVDPKTQAIYKMRRPYTPAPFEQSGWVWQTSGDRGPRIPGINLDVDRDVFWGTELEFRKLYTKSVPEVLGVESDTPKPFMEAATMFRAGEGELDPDWEGSDE